MDRDLVLDRLLLLGQDTWGWCILFSISHVPCLHASTTDE